MKRIYLDQNKWILLAEGWYNGNEEIVEIVNTLKEKIKEGGIIIPLSFAHVSETMKRDDKKSREKLWNFMMELSGNNTICPFSRYLTKIEARNVFNRRKGMPELDIKKWIFRKGISGLLGVKATLQNTEGIPQNILDEMLSKVDSFETFDKILSLPEMTQRAKRTSKAFIDDTINLNQVRDKERSAFKDKHFGNKVIKARHFAGEVFPILAELNKEFNLPVHAILKERAKEEDAEALLQEFPCEYSYFCLTDRRDRERTREIDPHDMNDIFSLSVAIPYCDIVFGEKMFLQIAKHSKLDKLYNTKLITSLNEFKELITQDKNGKNPPSKSNKKILNRNANRKTI